MDFEEAKLYLPQYLSSESKKELFKNLDNYPESIEQKKFYSYFSKNDPDLYQGDIIQNFKVCDISREEFKTRTVCIFSNTCDVSSENKRFFPAKVVYSPILRLKDYKQHILNPLLARGEINKNSVENHIKDIKNQYITQIFFLPQGQGLDDDYILFLDNLHSFPANQINPSRIPQDRIIALSNFGFYVFLFKLSVHFTRIREKIDRCPFNN